MEYCKQCGTCCKAIMLSASFKEHKQNAKTERCILSDVSFVVNNFIPINAGVAFSINSKLKSALINSPPRYFYICKRFDSENNKCGIHGLKIKPQVCNGFPVYDKKSIEDIKDNCNTYSEDCGYATGKVWEQLECVE